MTPPWALRARSGRAAAAATAFAFFGLCITPAVAAIIAGPPSVGARPATSPVTLTLAPPDDVVTQDTATTKYGATARGRLDRSPTEEFVTESTVAGTRAYTVADGTSRPVDAKASPRGVTKVLTFIEENHSLAQMKAGMPYLYSLATRYAYADNYNAITHPSEPNYVALAFGSTMGDTADHRSARSFSGPTVFGTALRSGHTAKTYAESMPSSCSRTSSGSYAVKHNPWPDAPVERRACAVGDVPSGSSARGALHDDVAAGRLPNVGLVVPNLHNDAHDGTLAAADNWLRAWLPQIITGPDFRAGRLAVIVTADEDNGTRVNKVLTVVLSQSLDGAHRIVRTPLNHYSWTRLQTDVVHAPCLRSGCSASNMAAAFALPLR